MTSDLLTQNIVLIIILIGVFLAALAVAGNTSVDDAARAWAMLAMIVAFISLVYLLVQILLVLGVLI